MADILKKLGMAGPILGKVSELVGETGGWISVVRSIFGRSGSTGGKTQEDGLKAQFMGAGENDEALFWSAVALAKTNGWVDDKGIQSISAIFVKLDYGERKRLYQIIGRDEQNVVIEMHSKTTGSQSTQAKGTRKRGSRSGGTVKLEDDKGHTQKITSMSNVRGALTIQLLAGMESTKAVEFLRNSGTLTGIPDDIENLYKKLSTFLKETGPEKKVREKLDKAVLVYLGAKAPEDAEAKVAAKEEALAHRRSQSWYERSLQKQPEIPLLQRRSWYWYDCNLKGLPLIWLALVIFSIIGLTYVFTH